MSDEVEEVEATTSEEPFLESSGGVIYREKNGAMQVAVVQTQRGAWVLPKGAVEREEAPEAAAIREVLEETGLDISIDGLIGLYSLKGDPVVLAVYAGQVRGGSLSPGNDATDVSLFSPSGLPTLPFPNDLQIMKDWEIFLNKFN